MWATALFVFLGLVGLMLIMIFVVPLFMPASYSIEKSITVNSPAGLCYDKVANLNHYRDWNPWSLMEPDADKKISGSPKTIGHRYEWEGKKIGAGSLTIKNVNPGKSLEFELEFLRPWRSKGKDSWTFESIGNQTKITWNNSGALAYPVARMMGPVILKNLNQQFEQGLDNIKQLCEK